jgi:hypothetical protein
MALQVRRGTNAERLGITPAAGELIFTTDTKQLFVGDGTTVGGNTSSGSGIDSLVADTSPQLGGELDLNSNNVTGTGNVNITGSITATSYVGTINNIVEDLSPQLGGDLQLNNNNIVGTGDINISGTITASGNINLGDNVGGDVLAIGAAIQGNLIPDVTLTHDLGSFSNRWRDGHFSSLDVSGHIKADSIQSDLIADDSTIAWNQSSNQFTGTFVGNIEGNVLGNIEGDVQGSVFGDSSTLLVDGINDKIVGDVDCNSITTATFNAIGNATAAVMRLQHTASSALGDDDAIATTIYRENTNTPYWTVGVAKNYYNVAPNPTGTPDYTKFLQVYKDGRVQIGGEAGGSGYDGWLRQPTADLEVYGNVHITDASELLLGSMTTTQRNALTPANGMMLYNTTDNKFQGYENGSWVNLI